MTSGKAIFLPIKGGLGPATNPHKTLPKLLILSSNSLSPSHLKPKRRKKEKEEEEEEEEKKGTALGSFGAKFDFFFL